MMKTIRIALLMIALALITGCSVRPQLLDESFTYPTIQQEGIAILPVGGEVVDRGIRKFIGLEFEKEMEKRYPDVQMIGVEKSGEQLVQQDLIDDYNKVIETYQMTEMIQAELLDAIREAVGFRYLVIPLVQNANKEKHEKGGYKYTISMESQVWDNRGSKIVFQIFTYGEDTPSSWIFDFGKMQDAARQAVRKAVKAFPKE